MPLVHDPGAEAEVDWGESRGDPARAADEGVHVPHAGVPSGGAFVVAFSARPSRRSCEAHVRRVRLVWRRISTWFATTTLKAAVAEGPEGPPTGRDRPVRGVALALPVQVAVHAGREQGAHEKGGVEGEVGRFRRRHLVPVPEVDSLSELNELIAAGFIDDLKRTIRGRSESVGQALSAESALLRALPQEAFDAREQTTPRVDSKALVTVSRTGTRTGCARGAQGAVKIGAREVERLPRAPRGRAPRAAAGPLRRGRAP